VRDDIVLATKMEMLVAQGKVVYTGSSNFAAWNIAQANEIAQQRHFLGLVSEQSLYNLVKRRRPPETIVVEDSQSGSAARASYAC